MNLMFPQKLTFPLRQFFNIITLTDGRMLLACLSIGFFVRLVPELLAFSTPIGFDTIYYAYVMKSGVVVSHWGSLFSSSWLLKAVIVSLYNMTKLDPFLLLKVIAPVLFGLNVAGVYWFSRKNLRWSIPMGLLAGVFFALQLASLRISWDLLRNTLGLGILMFALSYIKEVSSKRGFALFTGLSVLCVFAHEYAAVTLLFVVFGLLAWQLVRKQMNVDAKHLLLGVLPALSIFVVGLYLRLNPIRVAISSNVSVVGDTVSGNSGSLFFLVNYLQVQNSVDSYANYVGLAFSVFVLFALLYLPYLFLVVKGFFRNGILNFWTGLLLVGSFSCLIVPFSALQYWHRWMFMLAYPFTFYAVAALSRFFSGFREKRFSLPGFFSSRKAAFSVLLTFGLGIAYLATPVLMVFSDTSVPGISNTFLYFSTSPTVPYQDVEDVVQAMNWLNNNMISMSSVVLQHAFVMWGRLYLDNSKAIFEFDKDVPLALSTAADNGFNQVYFVWWNVPIGWYGVSLSSDFVSVQDFGRISVYAYEGELCG